MVPSIIASRMCIPISTYVYELLSKISMFKKEKEKTIFIFLLLQLLKHLTLCHKFDNTN